MWGPAACMAASVGENPAVVRCQDQLLLVADPPVLLLLCCYRPSQMLLLLLNPSSARGNLDELRQLQRNAENASESSAQSLSTPGLIKLANQTCKSNERVASATEK